MSYVHMCADDVKTICTGRARANLQRMLKQRTAVLLVSISIIRATRTNAVHCDACRTTSPNAVACVQDVHACVRKHVFRCLRSQVFCIFRLIDSASVVADGSVTCAGLQEKVSSYLCMQGVSAAFFLLFVHVNGIRYYICIQTSIRHADLKLQRRVASSRPDEPQNNLKEVALQPAIQPRRYRVGALQLPRDHGHGFV
jgi:hypothetical protein